MSLKNNSLPNGLVPYSHLDCRPFCAISLSRSSQTKEMEAIQDDGQSQVAPIWKASFQQSAFKRSRSVSTTLVFGCLPQLWWFWGVGWGRLAWYIWNGIYSWQSVRIRIGLLLLFNPFTNLAWPWILGFEEGFCQCFQEEGLGKQFWVGDQSKP